MTYRCPWSEIDDLMRSYHDTEWGVPLHDDRKLFEFIVLDAFQAGLSWKTILYKRENFIPEKITKFDKQDYHRLLNDSGIIRIRQKIQSTIINAEKFIEVQEEFGNFDSFIWDFVDHKPIVNQYLALQ